MCSTTWCTTWAFILWIATLFKSIIKRSTASFCSLLTGNFVLSAEMVALVADYNADVKVSDVKEMLHPKLKRLLPLHFCLVTYCKFFLSIKLNCMTLSRNHVGFFISHFWFSQIISSCTEWLKYFDANNNALTIWFRKSTTALSQQWVILSLKCNYTGILFLFSSCHRDPLLEMTSEFQESHIAFNTLSTLNLLKE